MTTNRVRLLLLACFALVISISALPAFASGVRIVRLSLAQGDVQIDRNAGEGWEQAINNMPVIGGARLYAAENSKAELEFEDGSSVRLAGPTQISIVELSWGANGAPVNVIQVDSGLVYVNARLHHQDDFRITTSTGESFKIAEPSHLRFRVDQQVASLSVVDGEVAVQEGGRSNSTVRSGETYSNVLGQPESAARQEAVTPEPEDTWDQQRDTYNDQNASAGAQYSGSDDPNAAGVADLGNYGTYSDLPGYGVVWQPSGVGPDWDPYSYGAWSYYPGWGWTFVSGYPWGWAPFYYGNWCYVGGGRGWWWRPSPWRPGRGPHLPGGSGFHPQPRWAGHPGNNWNAPHVPSGAGRGTVAVAGSRLPVGPIGVTHAPGAVHGTVATRGVGAANGFVGGAGSLARGSAERVGPTSRAIPGSNSGVSVVGPRAPSGSSAGRNGYEVHRPPMGYSPRMSPGTAGAPRAYGYAGGGTTRAIAGPSGVVAGPSGVVAGPSGAVHVATPPAMTATPHVSGGGAMAAPHTTGGSPGGFSGGGGFHGGGFSGGGGGFHGGGGGGHR